MKYSERKQFMESLDPDALKGGTDKRSQAEGHFRYYVVQLLADIADQLGGMAYAYQEMLKIQQSKTGAAARPAGNSKPGEYPAGDPNAPQSRYGGGPR